jgi:hypothetical protein
MPEFAGAEVQNKFDANSGGKVKSKKGKAKNPLRR